MLVVPHTWNSLRIKFIQIHDIMTKTTYPSPKYWFSTNKMIKYFRMYGCTDVHFLRLP